MRGIVLPGTPYTPMKGLDSKSRSSNRGIRRSRAASTQCASESTAVGQGEIRQSEEQGTTCINPQPHALSLRAVNSPERSALEEFLEHRWKSGAALFEMSLQRELAARECEARAQVLLLQSMQQAPEEEWRPEPAQAISAAVITAEAAQDAPAASWALAAQPVHLAEPVQGGELSSSVQKRRSMRRLRWQQAATAAAVAGAIAGVESSAVLEAAKARLSEERALSASPDAFRGAGERLRQWTPLSGSFRRADHALQRQPRVFRAPEQALQSSRRRRSTLLRKEEEMRLALAVSRSRELQKELDAVEASGGRGLSLPEAAQLPTWPSAQQMGVILEQGRSARATLYERNLGLAHKGAYSYYTHSDRSVPYPDLVQASCWGLMEAVERFDPTKGTKFGTYAVHWIRCKCSEVAAAERDVIYVPYEAAQRRAEVANAQSALKTALDREPTVVEIGEALGLSVRQVERSLSLRGMSSVFMSAAPPGNLARKGKAAEETWDSLLVSEDEPLEQDICRRELAQQLDALLMELPERQRLAVRLSYGLDGSPPLRQIDIANMLGVSHQAVHGFIKAARKRLQAEHKTALEEAFLNLASHGTA